MIILFRKKFFLSLKEWGGSGHRNRTFRDLDPIFGAKIGIARDLDPIFERAKIVAPENLDPAFHWYAMCVVVNLAFFY